jgi:threonine aldolase
VLAGLVATQRGFHVDAASVETNIVNVDVDVPAEDVAREARALGVAINASGPRRLRAVTHLDVSRGDMAAAAAVLAQALDRASGG